MIDLNKTARCQAENARGFLMPLVEKRFEKMGLPDFVMSMYRMLAECHVEFFRLAEFSWCSEIEKVLEKTRGEDEWIN